MLAGNETMGASDKLSIWWNLIYNTTDELEDVGQCPWPDIGMGSCGLGDDGILPGCYSD